MNLPKVSVITPSYNQAQYLEQCISSVLNQDYPNIEYIIVDGGSTDGSIDIIKKYEEKLSYWISEKDQGQSNAINKGFSKATGQIVAWLNSDDVYLPHAVSTAVKRFMESPELVLFYGDCVFIDTDGGFIRYFTEVEPWSMRRLLNYSDFIMQPTAFFSHKKLKEVGMLDEGLHYGMDWDLWCKLAKSGEVVYEPRVVAANREYETTKTKQGGVPRLKELLRILNRHKTGFWPHAFFGYCSTEIYEHSKHYKTRPFRLLFRLLAKGVSYMSPSAKAYNYKFFNKRNLYGLEHHSGVILSEEVSIVLPLRAGCSAVEVELDLCSGAQVELCVGDCITDVTGDGSQICKKLSISEAMIDSGMFELVIKVIGFEKDKSVGKVCGLRLL